MPHRHKVKTIGEEIQQTRPFVSLRSAAYLNLQRTAERLDTEFSRLLRSCGLSPPQYNVLRILRGAGTGGASCAQIGERMVTRVPDVTRLVTRLESAGYVERERSDADRRVVKVRILPAGKQLVDDLDVPVVELHERQFAELDDDEVASLSRLLERSRHRRDDDTAP